jgi:ribonuclease G
MKKILINVRPWEKRIAIVEDGVLVGLYFDSKNSLQLERSFFKGKVAKVLNGVQSAFVDIGQEKAGFLHISEIDRDLAFKKNNSVDEDYDQEDFSEKIENEDCKLKVKDIDISSILKESENVLVQVCKEPINEKGAKLTTCFTIPGRFVVFMPNISRIGISRRIYDQKERKRLKDIVLSVLPKGSGCIIRTTCNGVSDSEIEKDLNYLIYLWSEIQKKYLLAAPEECVYSDIDLSLQTVRDHLDSSIESIVCDDKNTCSMLVGFIKMISPDNVDRVVFHNDSRSVFDVFNVEKQIQESLYSKVDLESGGSIVIDSAEAMTVIDVNTARYSGTTRFEETVLRTNLEAAKEIIRQLKLRNIGGLIVIDFIDMASASNRNKLFSFFEKTLKDENKTQSVVLKISEFGLVQMARKRTGRSLRQQVMEQCSCCYGAGVVKSIHAKAYEFFRAFEKFILESSVKASGCLLIVPENIAKYLLEVEFDSVIFLEKKYNLKLIIKGDLSIKKSYQFELFV